MSVCAYVPLCGLPAQVELVDGVSILAGDSEVVVLIDGKEVAFNAQPSRVWEDGNSARVEGSALSKDGRFSLQTRSHVDFDGFTEVKLRIVDAAGQAVSPERLGKLSVRLALDSDIGRFVHRVVVQDVLELDGFGFQGPAGPLWVGDQRGGMMFSFDTPLFFSEDRRNQVRVVQEDDRVWMELNFVDGAGQSDPDHLFRFFLLPTPTKPMPEEMARPLVTDYKFEMWSDWQGYPDLAKIPELKKWATAVSDGGRIPILYTCQGLAEDAPYFEEFEEDMMIQPRWTFYRRHHNPGKGVPVHATSKRGPEGDLQLWAFQKLANEANISGILSDGLSIAWSDSNPGNLQGGGRPTEITWEGDTLTQVTGQRNFLKRLRGIFHDTGRPLAMSAHTGGGLDPNTLSFFDYYIDGEQLSRYPSSYQPSLPIYSIGYSGHPWGLRSTFWIKRWVRSEGPFRALTFALLHDNEIRDNTQVQEVLQIIKNTSGGVAPEFVPYWEPEAADLLESRSGMSKLSLYRTAEQTLAAAGNFGMDADTVTIDFSSLGGGKGSRVEDVLSGKIYELESGSLSLELEPGRCVALLLPTASSQAAASAQTAAAPNTESATPASALTGWELGAGAKSGRLASGQAAIVLSGSQAGSDKDATATFTAYPIAPDGSAELLVHLTGNLRLWIGSAALIWTHERGWRAEGFLALNLLGGAATSNADSPLGWPNLGTLYNPQLTTRENGQARFATLRLSLRNGILDATLDNQPLARGLQWGSHADWGQPMHLSLGTWGGNEVSFAPVALSPEPVALYEGGLGSPRVAAVAPQGAFFFERVPNSDWKVNLGASGVSARAVTFGGGEALQLRSGREAGVATLEETLGDNFSAVLRFEKLPKRFSVSVGPIVLKYDGRWVLDGPLGGWGRGVGPRTPDKALSPQPKIAEGEPVVMVISMKDGVLDIVVNNELLARAVAFNIPKAGNRLSIRTWAGFDAVFRLENLSSNPVTLYTPVEQKHPVK